jgi:uncharacterized membrane protein (DUF373 family)
VAPSQRRHPGDKALRERPMLNVGQLRREWASFTSYERFEQIVSRIIMLFVALVIVYALMLTGMELIRDFQLGMSFLEQEMLQDIFGSILTILILLEFNHSIAVALANRIGVIQVRTVVLLTILVIARKLILLDFKSATLEQLAGLAGTALALGVLYWLIRAAEPQRLPKAQPQDGSSH